MPGEGATGDVLEVLLLEQFSHRRDSLYQLFHGDLLSVCREGSSPRVGDGQYVGWHPGSGAYQPVADAIAGNAALSGHVNPGVPGYDGTFNR